jgi:homoserine kinase type II
MKHFEMGSLYNATLISTGFANQNYKLETENGSFLLRFCRQQPLWSIKQEIALMAILRKIDFPCAYPIPNSLGEYISYTDSNIAIVYNYVQGETPVISEQTVASVATAVASLNQIDPGLEIVKPNIICRSNIETLIASFDRASQQYTELYRVFTAAYKELQASLYFPLPKGIVHGDIFPENTIFSHGKLKAIIDFEEFAVDDLLFDVGMTINGFCFIHNELDDSLLQIFLDSYEKVRPLIDVEKKLLFTYIRWTALGMAAWHLMNDMLNVRNQDQEMRVQELLQRVKKLKNGNI